MNYTKKDRLRDQIASKKAEIAALQKELEELEESSSIDAEIRAHAEAIKALCRKKGLREGKSVMAVPAASAIKEFYEGLSETLNVEVIELEA